MSDEDTAQDQNSRGVSVSAVCFWGRCPRCDRGQIFTKFLGLKAECPHCALDLEPFQQADGPAFFVILIAGALMTPIALWLARAFDLQGAAYIATISVLTAFVVVGLLRLAKGVLLAAQYRTDAREGRLDECND